MHTAPTILYRADGSHTIGLGHIVRAQNLCAELRKRNITPIIITRSPQSIVENLRNQGFDVVVIPDNTDQLRTVLETQQNTGAEILINDTLNTDAHYISALQSAGIRLIHFDDLGSGRQYADILIDANLTPQNEPPDNHQLHLYGKDYMALDPRLASYHQKEKTIPQTAKNIVLSFGGSDPRELTHWLVDNNTELLTSFDVTVVAGNAQKNILKIADLCTQHGYMFVHNTADMPSILFHSDLAIISGGITLYETACAGTPSLVIPQVEHQYDIAKHFEQAGITLCPFSHEEYNLTLFQRAFKHLAYDKISRTLMSQKGKNAVDGNGIFRIASIIETFIKKRDIQYVQI